VDGGVEVVAVDRGYVAVAVLVVVVVAGAVAVDAVVPGVGRARVDGGVEVVAVVGHDVAVAVPVVVVVASAVAVGAVVPGVVGAGVDRRVGVVAVVTDQVAVVILVVVVVFPAVAVDAVVPGVWRVGVNRRVPIVAVVDEEVPVAVRVDVGGGGAGGGVFDGRGRRVARGREGADRHRHRDQRIAVCGRGHRATGADHPRSRDAAGDGLVGRPESTDVVAHGGLGPMDWLDCSVVGVADGAWAARVGCAIRPVCKDGATEVVAA
jgi:hypothetical protein